MKKNLNKPPNRYIYIYILIICFLTLVVVSVVKALSGGTVADGFRVDNGEEITVDINNPASPADYPAGYQDCKKVKNDHTTKKYFIPTRSKKEWDAFVAVADTGGRLDANFTITECCTPSCGSFTCGDQNDGCGGTINCGNCSGTDVCESGSCVASCVSGSLDTNFGTNGVIALNLSLDNDIVLDITSDSNFIYASGYDSSPGNRQWRIEKRNIILTSF